MHKPGVGRREFVKSLAGSAAAVSALPAPGFATPMVAQAPPRIRFSVIGINHGHINSQVQAVQRGGGELVSMFAKEPDLTAAFVKRFPTVKVAKSEAGDPRRQVDPAGRQRRDSRRAGADRHPRDEGRQGLHGRQARHHHARAARRGAQGPGRDEAHLLDHVQRALREPRDGARPASWSRPARSARSFRPSGSARTASRCQTRPAWFFERARYGGILCDIASHQADQFLFFTGSTRADVVASQVGNVNHPQYPGLEDFGDMMVRGDGGTGYIRVDWFTPDGLVDLGRRPADDPRHRRLHRDPQERRHRRPPRRQSPVPRRPEGDALHRLHQRRPAVRPRSSSTTSSIAPRRR